MVLWNKLTKVMINPFAPKSKNHRAQGSFYENKAREYLEAQGLSFVAANQNFKCGELDLVMQQGQTIVFVEVRQRRTNRFGSAVESVDFRKQQKWLKAANMWLAQRNLCLESANCRFDIVAFEGNNSPLWIPNFLG